MSEKIKCEKCGLFIERDMPYCPYCGYENHSYSETIETPLEEEEKDLEVSKEEQVTEEKEESSVKNFFNSSLFKFPSRELNVKQPIKLTLFLLGFIGLNVIATIFTYIAITNPYFASIPAYSAAVNFACYLVLFGIMVMILNISTIDVLKDYKKIDTWAQGLKYGFILIIASILLNTFLQTVTGISSSNANENSVNSIVTLYPVLSVLIFGIVGPICEEFTYRVGFFSFIRKYSRVAAYVISAIFFGLIHFDFTSFGTDAIYVELINLPTYILAGVILCYAYEKKGLGVSIFAHCTNNLISVLITICLIRGI